MTLTNKRLKHLAKRGKASIAEQRELAARVLQAEKPRPQGRRVMMWDLRAEAVRNFVRGEVDVRLTAEPFLVEVLKPHSNELRIEHRFLDEQTMRLPRIAYEQEILRMAAQLGEAVFSDPRTPRSSLLAMLAAAPNTPETGR